MKCPLCDHEGPHDQGYGLAAGPMGDYTYCAGCERLIDFAPDLEGLSEEQTAKVLAWCAGLAEHLATHSAHKHSGYV